jgi:hypothetical protein
MSKQPRKMTTEEVRERFLQQVWAYIDYWERDSRTPSVHGKLSGLAFSMLVILDGGSPALPSCIVAPQPHPDDKKYHQENGDNWFPENNDVAIKGDIAGCLHEQFHAVGRKMGLEK